MVAKPSRHKVAASMTQAFEEPDGKGVEITFASDQGGVTLVCAPEVMLNLASKMSELASHALAVKGRVSGHETVNASQVAAAAAQAPVGAAVVVLAFRGTNKIVQHFSLTPEESAALRPQMEAGEIQARKNRKTTIQ